MMAKPGTCVIRQFERRQKYTRIVRLNTSETAKNLLHFAVDSLQSPFFVL